MTRKRNNGQQMKLLQAEEHPLQSNRRMLLREHESVSMNKHGSAQLDSRQVHNLLMKVLDYCVTTCSRALVVHDVKSGIPSTIQCVERLGATVQIAGFGSRYRCLAVITRQSCPSFREDPGDLPALSSIPRLSPWGSEHRIRSRHARFA